MSSRYEPPDTDPYVRWCERAAAVRPPPIPIVWICLDKIEISEPVNFGQIGIFLEGVRSKEFILFIEDIKTIDLCIFIFFCLYGKPANEISVW